MHYINYMHIMNTVTNTVPGFFHIRSIKCINPKHMYPGTGTVFDRIPVPGYCAGVCVCIIRGPSSQTIDPETCLPMHTFEFHANEWVDGNQPLRFFRGRRFRLKGDITQI